MSILHCHFQQAKIIKIKLNWQIRKKNGVPRKETLRF